ncbi:MAG: GNAT family N-acetyltransferase [Firmicutes bacterium]|nr:GNAT family N-acetyltransferase [Bacillota bacterium]
MVIIKKISDEYFQNTVGMITELMNFHRKLTNAPKEFWTNDNESKKTLKEWIYEGEVYNIFYDKRIVGFFYVKFGGQNAAWLEDIFIAEEYRKKGIGKKAIKELDKLMKEKNITAMFLDVIPRNTKAIKFYKELGFDHLNLIQLRKNYDKRLNKNEEIDLLGFKFKKY